MTKPVNKVVIVGGGSAGWLTAGLIAAEHAPRMESGFEVVLIESPDVSPIGVGEGTWPTMRATLQTIGISETAFLRECDASFKQGTRFSNWGDGKGEFYYHPFAPPLRDNEIDLARFWLPQKQHISFADAVTPQSCTAERGLAPKQITTPEYSANLNYGYHLDAGKFAQFLQRHCVGQLGVKHTVQNVVEVKSAANGDIDSLVLQSGENVHGDLFVDCTGFVALLLGKHYEIPVRDLKNYLFNDRALAVQLPCEPDDAIASTTLSTAQRAGWIWDIALPTRRGIGYVYASTHTSDSEAEEDLRRYLALNGDARFSETCAPRQINFSPSYRKTLWHRNCVGVGLSGGFVEPLEASALVMIELSAKMISEQLPANRSVMDVVSRRFNEKFQHHWQSIVDFLKLHYVLSRRQESDYWKDNRNASSIPEELVNALELWRYQCPWYHDLPYVDELFPATSYRYVLYGMGYDTQRAAGMRGSDIAMRSIAEGLFRENIERTGKLAAALPTNRELLKKVYEYGFQKI